MGMVGLLFKKDIAAFSQPLAIGLSTGFCGSLTTYASWNQRMMSILAFGLVLRALFGYVLGTAVAMHSFEAGVDAGRFLQDLVRRRMDKAAKAGKGVWQVEGENFQRNWGSLVGFVGLSILLWAVAGVLFAFNTSYPKVRKASLACLVGPLGCWLRWYLSRLNGRGLGKAQRWTWVPFGTLAANLLAVLLEAVSSAIDATVRPQLCPSPSRSNPLGPPQPVAVSSPSLQPWLVSSPLLAAVWVSLLLNACYLELPGAPDPLCWCCVPCVGCSCSTTRR